MQEPEVADAETTCAVGLGMEVRRIESHICTCVCIYIYVRDREMDPEISMDR